MGSQDHQEGPNRVLSEDLSDPLFFVDPKGRVLYWNAACESAFGVSAAEAVSAPLSEIFGRDLDEGLELLLCQSPEQVRPTLLPGILLGDGTWDVRVAPTASLRATAVYCLPFVGQLAGWPRLLADSVDAIWALDAEDRIVAWNRGASDLFGYSAAEIVGQPLSRLVPADLLEAREPDRLRTALRELGAVRDYETRRVTKDGREIRVSLTRTSLRDRSGKVVGSSTIVRDLSQRERIERQIIESEKLATLGQLSGSIAQEIGAPLTAIGLAVESVRKSICEKCNDCESGRQLMMVQQQLGRIGRLTRQLVELAKPGALQLTRARVGDVIQQTLELLEPSARRAGLRISSEIDGSLPEISVDIGQLQQVLLNLFLNAQRALAGLDGGRVEISAKVRPGLPHEGRPVREVVEIRVSDNGPGIDPMDLPFIFSPFFSRSGGSGLGLPLAQQIVHAHGGTIEASSTPGEGAKFTIQIPVDTDE